MSESLQNTRKVNCKKLIVSFSVIGILFALFSQVFFTLDYIIDAADYINIQILMYMTTDLLHAFFIVLTSALLLLYVLFLYKKFNAKIILAISFLLLSYPILTSALNNIIDLLFEGDFEFEYLISDFAFDVLPYLLLWLAAILVLFGVKNKIVYVVALVLSAFPNVYYFMSWVSDISDFCSRIFDDYEEVFEELFDSWCYYLFSPIWYIGSIMVTVSVIVFIVSNNDLISKKS